MPKTNWWFTQIYHQICWSTDIDFPIWTNSWKHRSLLEMILWVLYINTAQGYELKITGLKVLKFWCTRLWTNPSQTSKFRGSQMRVSTNGAFPPRSIENDHLEYETMLHQLDFVSSPCQPSQSTANPMIHQHQPIISAMDRRYLHAFTNSCNRVFSGASFTAWESRPGRFPSVAGTSRIRI